MAAPGSGHPIEQRLLGVRIGRHIGDREVRNHEAMHQGGKGCRNRQERCQRGAFACAGQGRRSSNSSRRREDDLTD